MYLGRVEVTLLSAAVSLRVAEQYVKEFGKLAQTNNTMILPAELSNIGSAVAAITKTLETARK